ncbi:MAG: hypothetical protein HQK65_00245 [Desulfamplus sp.]|nr:hypothetical protein [Desulfamplus sp.]
MTEKINIPFWGMFHSAIDTLCTRIPFFGKFYQKKYKLLFGKYSEFPFFYEFDLIFKKQLDYIKESEQSAGHEYPIYHVSKAVDRCETAIRRVHIKDSDTHEDYLLKVIDSLVTEKKSYAEFEYDEDGYASATFSEITYDVEELYKRHKDSGHPSYHPKSSLHFF